jgi:hypothetical protein
LIKRLSVGENGVAGSLGFVGDPRENEARTFYSGGARKVLIDIYGRRSSSLLVGEVTLVEACVNPRSSFAVFPFVGRFDGEVYRP